MIFDRTEQDVREARDIRDSKLLKGEPLTNDDIIVLEKGMFTFQTINRIERKQSEVALLMNGLGYVGFGIESKQWQLGDIFTSDDFDRIIKNLDILKNAFMIYSITPQTPLAKYHFENINDIEKILFDLETMVEDVKSNYRYCGEYECGGDV